MHYTPDAISHEAFVRRVEALRKDRGINVPKLAALLGEAESTIKNMLYKKTTPNRDRLVAMATVLDTTVEYLATGYGPADHQEGSPVSLIVRSLHELAQEQGFFPADEISRPISSHLTSLTLPLPYIQQYGLSAQHTRAAQVENDVMAPFVERGMTILIDVADRKPSEGLFIVVHHGSALIRNVSLTNAGFMLMTSQEMHTAIKLDIGPSDPTDPLQPRLLGRVKAKFRMDPL
ncbi:XRE family transcriptional regulator [Pseudomonas oryzihabitans]|uniref:XRE family transcriptional regulator n=1 Tax=Pseudomonas oryzihabitans TaxID=47885 RepID=UPI00214F5C54|nr:helix-turn-helix domain-containing protein [Pseudomonas psychrotolerans]UUW74155.1 helix-turn-helix domain-containing protein [Pseudomonas psychrotolerans]